MQIIGLTPLGWFGVKVTSENHVKSLLPYYFGIHDFFMDCASSLSPNTNERIFDNDVASLEAMMKLIPI